MLLKSLKLHNIRSYINEEINFPNGSLLLSGDVGSGKSSILLAVEFALFGILRGDLSGGALLRNGAKDGFVELYFEIEGNEVVIRRNLKRSSSSIEQDAGYIRHKGTAKAATAQELKTAVLDLLGYPKDLLTKSKSLIYRYTVYTPQEEMKRIIFDDKETRLNILRKVFDIDKYKRIQENAGIYMAILRGRIRECEGIISDLAEKRKVRDERIKEAGQLDGEIKNAGTRLSEVKAVVELDRSKVKELEERARKLDEFKKELKVCETELMYKQERINFNSYEIERLEKQVKDIEQELGESREDQSGMLASEIKTKNELLQKTEKSLLQMRSLVSEANAHKRHSDELKSKILSLSTCPVCLQQVSQEHKKGLAEKEDARINEFEVHISEHNKKILLEEANLRQIKISLEALRNEEKKAEAIKVRLVALREKQQSGKDLLALQEKLKTETVLLENKKAGLNKEIERLAHVEQEHDSARKEFEKSLELEKEALIIFNRLKQKCESVHEMLKELEKELQKKEIARQRLELMQGIHNWTDAFFINIVRVMEKRFMAMVYNEFNELFCNWMNVLVESELIQARLDEDFTPVIQQNGYDIEVENLSGGEKTACALAYRLALNKVINGLMTSVKTRDLLILDEPTDGFSPEQIDKIRDVLKQLQARQVLIVSHESRIESFVDNVLRVQKEEHVSRVEKVSLP